MIKVTFFGSILPQTMLFSVPFIAQYKFDDPDSSVHVTMRLGITNSIVTAECDLSEDSHCAFTYAYVRAVDMARAITDVMAFKLGEGLIVILDKFSDERNPEIQSIRINDPELSPLCHSLDSDERFQQVCAAVCSNSALTLALTDLLAANMNLHLATINCARAVEGIRHIISPGADPNTSWESLRRNLRIDRGYLMLITDNSKKHRHGDRVRIGSATIKEIMKRSWIIMDRFIEFSLRGSLELQEAEFPTLKG